MSNIRNILIVEDDPEASRMLAEYLSLEGYTIHRAEDGLSGLEQAYSLQPDLLILDIMLPEMDGLTLLRRLRETSNTPVLMLSARRDDIDKVMGLEFGADDYLGKPYSPRELVARIHAIDRRCAQRETVASQTLKLHNLNLSPLRQEALIDQQPVELTRTEFQILQHLLQHAEQAVRKQQLSLEVLGRELESYDRSLDVHVSNLRKKLQQADISITTVRGVGYRLEGR
ncbi:response regulator transcription factor [Aliamphritea spongicola]|uniref:response regulator transcription factor n=1 Tax=Aliamphritea spongicola TaxID=707589 RepID=UPI001A9C519F|nr:response regulator transcription factor [Aliamphritea spongicola]